MNKNIDIETFKNTGNYYYFFFIKVQNTVAVSMPCNIGLE
jgi:hypothetical protein